MNTREKEKFDNVAIRALADEAASLIHALGEVTPEEIEIIAWAFGEEFRRAQYKQPRGGEVPMNV